MLMLTTPENGDVAVFGSTRLVGESGGAPALITGTALPPRKSAMPACADAVSTRPSTRPMTFAAVLRQLAFKGISRLVNLFTKQYRRGCKRSPPRRDPRESGFGHTGHGAPRFLARGCAASYTFDRWPKSSRV